LTDLGKYRIVLDLSDVDYVSSAGLRVMIDIQKTCSISIEEWSLIGVPNDQQTPSWFCATFQIDDAPLRLAV
jgi:anti-anti-sigma regulatory factor